MLDDWMLGLMAEAEGETHAITEVAKLLSRAPDPRPGMLRCERCGRLTERRGNAQRFCPPCRLESDREANRRWHKRQKEPENAASGVSTGETSASPESD
jgi:predicted amidophosphoribosyltransferase